MLPRDLHRLLLLSPAAVTNRLCRLEAKGFIERTSDQADRRNMPVVLTALGLNMVDRAMAACVQKGHDLFGGATFTASTSPCAKCARCSPSTKT